MSNCIVDIEIYITAIEDEFFARGSAYDASMESFGYVYVPQRCEPGTGGAACKLHVFFHGCGMQARSF